MQHYLQIEVWSHFNAEIPAIPQWGWRAFLVLCSRSKESTSAAFLHCHFCDYFHCRNDKVIISHNSVLLAVLHKELCKAAMIHLRSTSGTEGVEEWVHAIASDVMHFLWRIDEFHFRNVNWAIWVQVWTLCITAFHRGSEFTWPLPVSPSWCCFIFFTTVLLLVYSII